MTGCILATVCGCNEISTLTSVNLLERESRFDLVNLTLHRLVSKQSFSIIMFNSQWQVCADSADHYTK